MYENTEEKRQAQRLGLDEPPPPQDQEVESRSSATRPTLSTAQASTSEHLRHNISRNVGVSPAGCYITVFPRRKPGLAVGCSVIRCRDRGESEKRGGTEVLGLVQGGSGWRALRRVWGSGGRACGRRGQTRQPLQEGSQLPEHGRLPTCL